MGAVVAAQVEEMVVQAEGKVVQAEEKVAQAENPVEVTRAESVLPATALRAI